jgi:hypothetical protein
MHQGAGIARRGHADGRGLCRDRLGFIFVHTSHKDGCKAACARPRFKCGGDGESDQQSEAGLTFLKLLVKHADDVKGHRYKNLIVARVRLEDLFHCWQGQVLEGALGIQVHGAPASTSASE